MINVPKRPRKHTVMRVTHNKCQSLVINTGELMCMLKRNI